MKTSFYPLGILPLICLVCLSALAHKQSPPVPTPTRSLAPMLHKIMPAVVNLKAIRQPNLALTKDNSSQTPARPDINLASGVIVDASQGYILTNHHVIAEADEIIVTLSDSRHFQASLLGSDPLTDIALMQIKADNLHALTFGPTDGLQVGDFVLAIGNPFGLSQSVTSGIVSAMGRDDLGIEGYEDFIQTDASINPGNSGGALVDLQGRLVGINTAIVAPDGGSIGIGFAIPTSMATEIMQQLVTHGEVRRGILGVVAQPLTQDLMQALGSNTQSGALVAKVEQNSLAAAIGLQVGDLILSVNQKPVSNPSMLRNAIALIPVAQEFSLQIERRNTRQVLSATMSDPEKSQTALSRIHPKLSGLEIGLLEKDLASHGHVKGLEILRLSPHSPASQNGLRPGDIITSANQIPIASLSQLQDAATEHSKPLLLHILRGESALFLVLTQKLPV